MTPAEIIAFLERRRFPLRTEEECQRMIADQFRYAGVDCDREVRLSPEDIVDFMIGGVAIEVKLRGQRREIYRQCERYCEHPEVTALILATNASMGLPARIKDKPVFIANLGKAWL